MFCDYVHRLIYILMFWQNVMKILFSKQQFWDLWMGWQGVALILASHFSTILTSWRWCNCETFEKDGMAHWLPCNKKWWNGYKIKADYHFETCEWMTRCVTLIGFLLNLNTGASLPPTSTVVPPHNNQVPKKLKIIIKMEYKIVTLFK